MRVLVGCEHSGVVRDAFLRAGHDAVSCDLLPTETPGPHIQGDVLLALREPWDLFIVHPDCTYLCSSGLHWNGRGRGWEKTEAALEFVRQLLNANVKRICLENPVGCIGTRIRPATQYIHPYQFGHDASKRTGLWLKGLPKLQPTQYVAPRMVGGKPRWANQTDGGQNREPPHEDRWKIRAKTYAGIATAMAEQWGGALSNVPALRQVTLF